MARTTTDMAMMMMLLLLIVMMGGGSEQNWKKEMAAEAATKAKATAAPAPAPALPPDWHNLTDVLVSAGYLTEFVNLVATETKVAEQWQSFINASNTTGATIFAPLDVAFQNKQVQALLSNISTQNLTTLLLYHSLPAFHSYKDLQLSSFDLNPTFATLSHGGGDSFLLNITNDNGDVTFHSSITDGNVSSNYYNDFPLSIFAIDQILVPTEIFGDDVHLLLSPAPSPSPALSSKSKTKAPSASMAFPRLHTPSPLLLALLAFFCTFYI